MPRMRTRWCLPGQAYVGFRRLFLALPPADRARIRHLMYHVPVPRIFLIAGSTRCEIEPDADGAAREEAGPVLIRLSQVLTSTLSQVLTSTRPNRSPRGGVRPYHVSRSLHRGSC